MIADAPACVALHLGGATTASALLGRVDGRWRLLGALSAPAAIDPDAVVATLIARLRAADPGLADRIGADDPSAWPRLVARVQPPPRLAVLAPTERTLERLQGAGRRAGWAVVGRSAQRADPLEMTRLLLARDVRAVLVGAGDPPAADERSVIDDLAALVAAAAERRPELTIVLAGGFGDLLDRFSEVHQAVEPVAARPAELPPVADAAIPRPDDPRGVGGWRSTGGDRDGDGPEAEDAAGAAAPVDAEAPGAPEATAAGESPAARDPGPGDPGVPGGARAAGDATSPDAAGPAEPNEPPVADAVRASTTAGSEGRAVATARPGTLIVAPAPSGGVPPDEPLRRLLDDLRAAPDDAWRATVRSTETLAALLERRVETISIGQSAALRVVATPLGATGTARAAWAVVPEAALVPEVDESLVDRVLRWSTTTIDRYRMRDRLAELRLAPWAEAHGDGAPLRLAAARAALERLVAATPELDRPVPDLLIAAGGVWAAAPGPAVALALADVVRRPGASQLALDHARLLGPLGMIADPASRSQVLSDLADDLIAPLGSLVLPAGLRASRSAGRLVVHAAAGTTELDLVPGGLELVDLPPGESAIAEFSFTDTVILGTRGRRFALQVGGGLGGLLVDLRDVPLRLPDRPERRRELLGAWQRAMWVGLEA